MIILKIWLYGIPIAIVFFFFVSTWSSLQVHGEITEKRGNLNLGMSIGFGIFWVVGLPLLLFLVSLGVIKKLMIVSRNRKHN